MGKFLSKFNQKLLITDKKNYSREQLQSFMTGPEWRNVEMAEEFAEFVKEKNSIFHFPYFRQVADLWRIVFQSYKSARKYDSHAKIWFATDYMMMDLFIAFFTTLELIPKGIISFFIRPFIKKENPTLMQTHLGAYFEKYANKLHTVPFYDHPYKEEREALKKIYRAIPHKTFTDRLSWFFTSIELWARRWISKPLHFWFHQESNLVSATTDVLVKYHADNVFDPEEAKQQFLNKLQQTEENEKVKTSIVNQQVYAKEKKPNKSYTSIYARLRVPRYDDFQATAKILGEKNIVIQKIAGNDHIQVKCVLNASTTEELLKQEKNLKFLDPAHSRGTTSVQSAKHLYDYVDRIHHNKKTLMFDVPVKNLQQTVNEFNNCEGTHVKFIHNF